MSAASERKILRWMHILLSIPIIGYIYGPVAEIPQAAAAVRFVFLPLVALSGLWMWKGSAVRKAWARGR
jgi:thiosulfate reductase cytochrome b subunit